MKRKFSVNLMGSIFLAIMIYIYSVGAESAKADCVDVTNDTCFSDIFDVPWDGSESHFLWLLYRRNQEYLNKLRTLKIQIDTCNMPYGKPCQGFYEECLYFKYATYSNNIDFGFKKTINSGDTISVDDIDVRNTELIKVFEELKSIGCPFKIIVDYYFPTEEHEFFGTLVFDSYIQGNKISKVYWDMYEQGYGRYVEGLSYTLVFDYTVNINNEEKPCSPISFYSQNDDELIIRLTEFDNINQVEIYDLLGICQIRSQIQGSETVIDISNLTRGVYIVRVGSHFSKFIKE